MKPQKKPRLTNIPLPCTPTFKTESRKRQKTFENEQESLDHQHMPINSKRKRSRSPEDDTLPRRIRPWSHPSSPQQQATSSPSQITSSPQAFSSNIPNLPSSQLHRKRKLTNPLDFTTFSNTPPDYNIPAQPDTDGLGDRTTKRLKEEDTSSSVYNDYNWWKPPLPDLDTEF